MNKIELNHKSIKMDLVSCTHWKSDITNAWCNSRPNVDFDSIKPMDIIKMDIPVADFGSIVIKMDIPILFRDIMAADKSILMWCRSSCVDDLSSKWDIVKGVPLSINSDNTMSVLSAISSGESQDDYRKFLPMSYMTGVTCRMPLRTAMKLYWYFNHLCEEDNSIYLQAEDFISCLGDIFSSIGINLGNIEPNFYDLLPIPTWKGHELETKSCAINNIISIVTPISLGLRAQVIRHRVLTVSDYFSELLLCDDIWSMNSNKMILTEITATTYDWKKALSKRFCWLSHSKFWEPIASEVEGLIGGGISLLLPCDEKQECPFNSDCNERIKGSDPAAPCPIHAKLHDVDSSEIQAGRGSEWLEEMRGYSQNTTSLPSFWDQRINALKGS